MPVLLVRNAEVVSGRVAPGHKHKAASLRAHWSVWCVCVQAYFVALGVACTMALLLLAPMANLKSYVQREAIRKRKLKAA